MTYKDEMNEIIEKAINNAKKTARVDGYMQGLLDYHQAIMTTHMTPAEILKKLNPYNNKY